LSFGEFVRGERNPQVFTWKLRDLAWQGFLQEYFVIFTALDGKDTAFWRFVVSPEAVPNSCNISKVISISLAEGLKKSTTSSAYKEIL